MECLLHSQFLIVLDVSKIPCLLHKKTTMPCILWQHLNVQNDESEGENELFDDS